MKKEKKRSEEGKKRSEKGKKKGVKKEKKGVKRISGGGRWGGKVRGKEKRFSLVSLFNGISTFVGYLMLKPFSEKNSSGTI